jgi:tetrahydromethanopterin S-methyltransferase subunit G
MTHLAKFTRDQNVSQAHNISAAIDKVKKEREAVEDQVEFLEARYRQMIGD